MVSASMGTGHAYGNAAVGHYTKENVNNTSGEEMLTMTEEQGSWFGESSWTFIS